MDLTSEEARRGAIDAIATILQARTGKLKVTKDQEENKDDKTAMKIPKAAEIDTADKDLENGGVKETEQEKKARLARIKDATSTSSGASKTLQQIEDEKAAAELRKIQADKDQERRDAMMRRKLTGGNIGDFKTDLHHALAKQAKDSKMYKEKTWARLNPAYDTVGFLVRGSKYPPKGQKGMPTIAVYFDQSGSWGEDDVKVGLQALKSIDDLVRHKVVSMDIFYFTTVIGTSAKEVTAISSGTLKVDKLIEHIQAHKYDNVVIMSDSDINPYNRITYEVPGCVFWMWRSSYDIAKIAKQCLTGRRGNFNYILQ